MPPANNFYGGGAAETTLGTGVLVLMLVAIVLVLVLPRKFVVAPLLFGILLLPAQTLVIGGFHLFVSRILILTGLGRAIASRSSNTRFFGGGYNTLDAIFILYVLFHASAFILLYREAGAVVNQFGFLWDFLGGYFLMRLLIEDDADIQRVIKILSAVAAVLAVTMLYEKLRDVNLYGFLASQPIIPEIRNGAIRAQGPFHHAILAGTFGATLLPLFFWLWKCGKSKFLGLLGMLASTAITFASASTTPASVYLAAILAISLWPLRGQMRIIRWGAVVVIFALNLAMHAPVWWPSNILTSPVDRRANTEQNSSTILYAISATGGSSEPRTTPAWGYEMWDQSNQYVADGETGGLGDIYLPNWA